jgi:hypothetical protein
VVGHSFWSSFTGGHAFVGAKASLVALEAQEAEKPGFGVNDRQATLSRMDQLLVDTRDALVRPNGTAV